MMPTMPGDVSTTESAFDGERQVHVDPGWLSKGWEGSSLKLGGFWSEKTPEVFALEVVYFGVAGIESVQVNVDGEIIELEPASALTDFDHPHGRVESGRRFVVPLEFVDRMMEAERVVFRVGLGGTRAEGIFSTNAPTTARPAFRKALARIDKVKAS